MDADFINENQNTKRLCIEGNCSGTKDRKIKVIHTKDTYFGLLFSFNHCRENLQGEGHRPPRVFFMFGLQHEENLAFQLPIVCHFLEVVNFLGVLLQVASLGFNTRMLGGEGTNRYLVRYIKKRPLLVKSRGGKIYFFSGKSRKSRFVSFQASQKSSFPSGQEKSDYHYRQIEKRNVLRLVKKRQIHPFPHREQANLSCFQKIHLPLHYLSRISNP